MQAEKKQQIPESLLKKQKRDKKIQEDLLKRRTEIKAENKWNREQQSQRIRKYHQDLVDERLNIIKQRRLARASGSIFVPPQSKIALIIRIRGINKLHPDLRKILKLFRLRQLHNATFVKLNKATLNMIKKILPYVTLGYPTRETISKLVYKRGYAKLNKQRIPITSNKIIEKGLFKYGISCTEDLIQEIYTCGPHFKEANNFIWPFKLRCPRGGFLHKRRPFHNNGDFGNREELINDLVKKML